MGSPWTDESAIVRDLSFAQGRWVPGGIDAAVAGGKPPIHNITEETEEEYFKHWTADGDFSTGPDLFLIKQMLELVHDEEPDIEDTPPGPIEISKLNPATPVFVPKLKKTAKKTEEKPEKKKPASVPKKPLRKRNVAIESLIAISEKLSEDIKEVPIKLSKPEDFIKTKEKPQKDSDDVEALNRKKDSVNKVNNWLLSQDISCMFKKKSSIQSLENEKQKGDSEGDRISIKKSPVRSPVSSVKTPQNGKQYVPSSWAGEYYKKCVDRSQMQQLVKEDIWVRAEKMMKEIDEQKAEQLRKQEEEDAALAAQIAAAEALEAAAAKDKVTEDTEDIPADSEEPQNAEQDKLEGIANWMLPQHRHLLTEECTVCKVLGKKTSEKPEEDILNIINPEEIEATFEQVIKETEPEETEPEKTEVKDEALFRLVRSSIVEDLTELKEPQKEYSFSESSLEGLDFA